MTVIAWFFWMRCIIPRITNATGNANPYVIAIHDPQLEANALPPLNPRNGDHACPKTGDITPMAVKKCSAKELGSNEDIRNHTGIVAFPMSKVIARIPTIHPEEIQALVAPGFPSPTSLASLPEIYLLNISDHGTDPLKKPTKVHIKKSIVGTLLAHLRQWFTRGRVPYQS